MELSSTFPEKWIFGAMERATLGTPVVLVADVVNGALESRYSALRAPGAAGGYQVTAGHTLWLTYLVVSATISNALWLTGSGTADAGDSQVAAPAGAASADSRADGVPNARVTLVALNPDEYMSLIRINAGRFPFLRCMSASATLRGLFRGVEIAD